MIKGNRTHMNRYTLLSPAIKELSEIIESTDWRNAPYERHELKCEGAYFNFNEFNLHVPDGKFEAHKRFVDLQYIVSGEETITCSDISTLTPCSEYIEELDFWQLSGSGDDIRLNAGEWVLLFPEDAHAPCIGVDGVKSKKIIAKIPVESFIGDI